MNEQRAPHLMDLNRANLLCVIFAYLIITTMIHTNINTNHHHHHELIIFFKNNQYKENQY